jgi:hypothetical protein
MERKINQAEVIFVAEKELTPVAGLSRQIRERVVQEFQAQAERFERLERSLQELREQQKQFEVILGQQLDALDALEVPAVSAPVAEAPLEKLLASVRNLIVATLPEQVFDVLCEEAEQMGGRAAVFDVRGKAAWGSAARGFGSRLPQKTFHRLVVSLTQENPFRQVYETGAHVQGDVALLKRNRNVLDGFKPPAGETFVLLPVRSAGSVSAIFYVDAGGKGEPLPTDALRILAEFAGAQLDRLMALSGGLPPEVESVKAAEEELASPEPVESTEAVEAEPGPSAPAAEVREPEPESPAGAPEFEVPSPASEVEVVPAAEGREPEPESPAVAPEFEVPSPASEVEVVPAAEVREPEPESPAVAPEFEVPSPAPEVEVVPAAEAPAPAWFPETPAPAPVAEEEKPVESSVIVEIPIPEPPPPAEVPAAEPVAAPAEEVAAPVAAPGSAKPEVAQLSEADQKIHRDARRFARLLVSEIELYNKTKVADGRKNKDIYKRLKSDIDRSRHTYEKRFGKTLPRHFDYFHEELVRSLASSDPSLLGTDYPGPAA